MGRGAGQRGAEARRPVRVQPRLRRLSPGAEVQGGPEPVSVLQHPSRGPRPGVDCRCGLLVPGDLTLLRPSRELCLQRGDWALHPDSVGRHHEAGLRDVRVQPGPLHHEAAGV